MLTTTGEFVYVTKVPKVANHTIPITHMDVKDVTTQMEMYICYGLTV
jgi:hypothetical protein